MVVKLYGFGPSTSSQRSAHTLIEMKVPFEFIEVDRPANEHKSDAYLDKHPFGQVPYLDDDGFIVYESRAISRYVATKWANQGPRLIPTDVKGLALFEQAVSVEITNFDRYALKVCFEKVIKPSRGGVTDVAIFEENLRILEQKLEGYERILGKSKYLAGDEPTLADYFHLPFAELLPATGVDLLSSRPNFARWFNDIRSRPTWHIVKDGVKSQLSY